MSYRQMKWFIILGPMITVECWEIIRHDFLHPYISMQFGNWLSALIVLTVTLLLTTKLFTKMEQIQDELQRERAEKALLVERERIARELHDGIAQSLFLLSVKINKLDTDSPEDQYQEVKKTIRRVHEDIRQSIANLRLPASNDSTPWLQTVHAVVESFKRETGIPVSLEWDYHGDLEHHAFSAKDKVELSACLREALMNIRKHALAEHVWINLTKEQNGWMLRVEDDGQGFEGDLFHDPARFGIRMMKERSEEMGWRFKIERANHRTRIEIRKER